MTELAERAPDGPPLGLPPDWPALRIPHRLTAAAPGWSTSADVIVVGSGVAGLSCALRLRRRVDRVLLVTKTVLSEGSTQWAQGGIAAALVPEDSPEDHLHDTLPDQDDATWRGNTSAVRAGDGSVGLTFAYPAPAAAAREASDPTVAEASDPIKEGA